jgi:hypothetical protein
MNFHSSGERVNVKKTDIDSKRVREICLWRKGVRDV